MKNQPSIQGVYLVGGLRFHADVSSFLSTIESAFIGGIRLFQLRVKDELSDEDHLDLARHVRKLTAKYGVTFIINDRPDIARLCEADGIHLGPGDMSVADARKIVHDIIVGKSSHNYNEAVEALKEDIDYLSVGPIYETDCKKSPDATVGINLLEKVMPMTTLPVVAIGGITLDRLENVKKTGVGCFGLIRGIMNTSNIQQSATEMVHAFKNSQFVESS